ncbi:unnamed protein product [marine sediment metagenome]|uniref:Coenzyme Q-binding protein COQ10 START domain-containing protein n=1 Tax=marine sediment metagenome TaxID=412755 RepID=X1A535_9ZZZZ
MPDIQRVEIVPYTPAEMYDLVNDIKNYPEFIPWCNHTDVLKQDEDEIQATLHFEGAGFTKSFTTHNRLQKNKMVEIRLINGPFKHMEGFWRFDVDGDNGCKIMLDLEFELAGGLLSLAFGPIFHQVANTLVDAFSKRAKEVYGER